jgi:hypothetical protein
MLTKTKIALAAALLASTASAALAQEGFFPSVPTQSTATAHATMRSAPVRLNHDIDSSTVTSANQENVWAVDSADRASSPYSGF